MFCVDNKFLIEVVNKIKVRVSFFLYSRFFLGFSVFLVMFNLFNFLRFDFEEDFCMMELFIKILDFFLDKLIRLVLDDFFDFFVIIYL